MKVHTRGFSVLKLMTFIILLGILATLVLSSIGSVEAKKRDEGRKQKINAIAAALEVCYTTMCNKTYPHIGELQDDYANSWVENNLPEFGRANLYDFKSVKIQESLPGSSAELQYEPHTSNGAPCVLYTDTCTKYILRAHLEMDAQNPYTKPSPPRE